jgi:hypothetical protein
MQDLSGKTQSNWSILSLENGELRSLIANFEVEKSKFVLKSKSGEAVT